MVFETLFVPAVDEDSFTLSLQTALPLSKKLGRHLMALHVTERYPIAHVGEVYWHQEAIEAYEATIKAQSEKLESLFYDFCRDNHVKSVGSGSAVSAGGLSASWASREGQHYATLALAARQSDLIVLTLPNKDVRPTWQSMLLELLLSISGVPLLLNPEGSLQKDLPTNVMIAWNGSAEARRALVLSEPFLRKAKNIRIVSIGRPGAGEPSAEDMSEYLGRKGIEANFETVAESKTSVQQQLMTAAEDMKAELLVMGAYSHAKWREIILGGVTHAVLNAPPLPVFLAH